MLATVNVKERIVYPESDGQPIAESDLHAQETVALFTALLLYFENAADVYVAMDNFIYYEEGNPKACLSPDVYVVFGVEKKLRDSYKLWEENDQAPVIVFEITSKSTKREDTGKKKQLCERLGVAEYFLFDPKCDYLRPALKGYRLDGGAYAPIEPDAKGFLHCESLKLRLFINDVGLLRVADPVTGEILPRTAEYKKIAQREAEARRAAEAEVARLKEELNRLKKK